MTNEKTSSALDTKLIPDTRTVAQSDPVLAYSFPELVREVAYLSNIFPHQLLFFRGQRTDYKNKAGATTIYPSIYRDEPLSNSNDVGYI